MKTRDSRIKWKEKLLKVFFSSLSPQLVSIMDLSKTRKEWQLPWLEFDGCAVVGRACRAALWFKGWETRGTCTMGLNALAVQH